MIWKDIPGYEGFYKVSEKGDIKSLDSIVIRKGGKPYSRKEKILKSAYDKDGYKRIELNLRGKAKKYYVHRLVAMAFLPNPNNKEQINHINAIKDDNSVSNLEWCTNKENRNHAVIHKLQPLQFGDANPNVKLTIEKVLEIRKMKNQGFTNSKISKLLNVTPSNVNNIVCKRTWKWLEGGEKRLV